MTSSIAAQYLGIRPESSWRFTRAKTKSNSLFQSRSNFEKFYTSKYAGLWQIEMLEGQNTTSSPSVDVVHIADGNTGGDQARQPSVGIFCCNSRHVWLNEEATRIPYKLWSGPSRTNPDGWPNPEWPVLHLPSKPGNYRVYITTHRVFGHVVNDPYEDEGLGVSSNILNLSVK